MNTLARLQTFVTIARTRSISGAARQLGCSAAAASRQLDALEADMQARLFDRSTRSVVLSAAGERLLPHALAVLQSLEDARQSVDVQRVQATVRICSAVALGVTLLAPVLAHLGQRHGQLQTELMLDNAITAPFAQGVDVLVRTGLEVVDGPQDMVVREVGTFGLGLYAAPGCLAQQTALRSPQDLAQWPCVGHMAFRQESRVVLQCGRQQQQVALHPQWWCSDVLAVMHMVQAGAGVGVLPQWLAAAGVRGGTLVQLLPQWHLPQAQVRMAWRNQGPNRVAVSLVAQHLLQALQGALAPVS